MQETQKNQLFSDISTEESATINGGYHYDCYGYRGSGRYSRPVSYHYRSYHYNSRPVRYSHGYTKSRGYNNCY